MVKSSSVIKCPLPRLPDQGGGSLGSSLGFSYVQKSWHPHVPGCDGHSAGDQGVDVKKPEDTVDGCEILRQLMVDPMIYRVSSILLVQDFATIHSMDVDR